MTTSYHLTLVCVNTQEELAIDVEQPSALCAQRVAEDLYEGYRVVRIVRKRTPSRRSCASQKVLWGLLNHGHHDDFSLALSVLSSPTASSVPCSWQRTHQDSDGSSGIWK